MPNTNEKEEELKNKNDNGDESKSDVPADEEKAPADPYKEIADELQAKYDKSESDKENYRTATIKTKDENKELKNRIAELEEDKSSDPELIRELVQKEVQQSQTVLARNSIEEIAERFSDSPEHKKAILLTYENRIKASGTSRDEITSDIQDAARLINSDNGANENAELKRALASRNTRKSYASSGRNLESEQATDTYSDGDLTPTQKGLLDYANIKPSDVKRQ